MAFVPEEKFTDRNGRVVVIRSVEPRDAAAFIPFLEQIARETTFTLETIDRRHSLAALEAALGESVRSPHWLYLGVFDGARVVASLNISVVNPQHPALARTASFTGLVLKEYWSSGITARTFEMGIAFARQRGIRRLECLVQEENVRSVKFLQKFGFEIEGLRRQSIEVGGELKNEFYFSKILDEVARPDSLPLRANPSHAKKWKYLLAPSWRDKIREIVTHRRPRVILYWDEKSKATGETIAGLSTIEGVDFFGFTPECAAESPSIMDLSAQLTSIEDRIAALGEMDLVVSTDSEIAHLAGRMGRPVWFVAPSEAAITPAIETYPSARLFRLTPDDESGQTLRDALAKF